MEIFINNKQADITLDTEKTLGDVLSGIEQWISPAGNRIMKISLDGENIAVENLGPVFNREINDIKRLDISVSSFRELASEALHELSGICILYAAASFEERRKIADSWKDSPAAYFMADSLAEIYDLAAASFCGHGLSAQDLEVLLKERLREIVDPHQELANSEVLVKTVARRMEELPLDMQTGKDEIAAETINLFSKMGEKLFRILFVLKSEGLSMENFFIDNVNIRVFLDDFNKTLVEISGAYSDKDTVLVGDIAEYELAPKVLRLYEALKNAKISVMGDLPSLN